MSGTVAVRVPTILRTYTGGESDVAVPVEEGATLADVVAALETTFPGIASRVVDDTGQLRRYVYVDDDDVRFAAGLQTPTPDGTKVSVIPAVAGGSRRSPHGHVVETEGLLEPRESPQHQHGHDRGRHDEGDERSHRPRTGQVPPHPGVHQISTPSVRTPETYIRWDEP
jgi:molybdopterin converting factor small subunit